MQRLFICLLLCCTTSLYAQVYGPYAYTSGSNAYSLKSTFSSIWGGSAVQWQIDLKNTGTTPIDMQRAALWLSSAMVPNFNNYAALGGISWPDALNRFVVNDVPYSIYQDTIILPAGTWVVNNLAPGNTFSILYYFNVASLPTADLLYMAQNLQFYALSWPKPPLFVPVTVNFSGHGGNPVTVFYRKTGTATYTSQTISSGNAISLRNNSSHQLYAQSFNAGSNLYQSFYTALSPLGISTPATTIVTLPFTSGSLPTATLNVSVSGLPTTASTRIEINGINYHASRMVWMGNGDSALTQLPVDSYRVTVSRYINEVTHKIATPCFQAVLNLPAAGASLPVHFSTCDIIPFGVPGWPDYVAMGTVTQPSPAMDPGLHQSPVNAIFKYAGNDGAGDRGLSYLTNPYLLNATIGTIQQARRIEHYYDSAYAMPGFRVMPVMIHYTANASGGGTVGAAPDILDSANLRIHYINLIKETQTMLSYKDSTHPYPGTLIVSPDLLGALQQDNSSQNTFPPYNYNNPSNFNANMLKSKVYVNQKLAEAFAACGLPTAGLPVFHDSLTGYFQSINYLVHHVGQQSVLLGWQENLWSTGSANWIHTTASASAVGQTVVNFLKDSLKVFTGTYPPDFFVIDRYERDCFSPGTSGSYAYNATKWKKTLDYAGYITKGVNLPLMLWQFPGGHLVHKDSAIVNYDLTNHASACGTWFMGEPSIGTNLNNIKAAELNISIPPGNYNGASTVQQLLAQDGAYDWATAQVQQIAKEYNVFAILWGGGSTTGQYNIGTNGSDDGWLAGKLREYYQYGRAYKTDSLCNKDDSTVFVRLFIEGYYAGAGLMQPVLMNQGVGSAMDITDSITVELHSATAPYVLVQSRKVVLHTDGTAACLFPSSLSGLFYIVVKHRNALTTWSANPVLLGNCPVSYTFSNNAGKAYGQNMKAISPGVWGFYSGELVPDQNIDLLDFNVIENDIFNFAFGYKATDLNGDGNVDLLDNPVAEENINAFIFTMQP